MSEKVLVGHKVFHKIVGETDRGNPRVKCGSHTQIQRVKVLKRHQCVHKDKCQICYKDQ